MATPVQSDIRSDSQFSLPTTAVNGNPGTVNNTSPSNATRTPPVAPYYGAPSQGTYYGYSPDSYSGGVAAGGQNRYLGRYTPQTLDNNGNWSGGTGPYSYNTPNSYGNFVPNFSAPISPAPNSFPGSFGGGSSSDVINSLLQENLSQAGLAQAPVAPSYSRAMTQAPAASPVTWPTPGDPQPTNLGVKPAPVGVKPVAVAPAPVPNTPQARYLAWRQRRLARLQGGQLGGDGVGNRGEGGGSFRGASPSIGVGAERSGAGGSAPSEGPPVAMYSV